MKISGPGRIQSGTVKKSSGKGKSDGVAFAKELGGNDDTQDVSSLAGASPVAGISSLIGIQEAPSSTESPSKGLQRAGEMLDLLEDIRKGILLGAIPAPRLRTLADMARNRKNQPQQDPLLAEILDDIELRAEVELAKLGL